MLQKFKNYLAFQPFLPDEGYSKNMCAHYCDIYVFIALEEHAKLDSYSATTLKQQSTFRNYPNSKLTSLYNYPLMLCA